MFLEEGKEASSDYAIFSRRLSVNLMRGVRGRTWPSFTLHLRHKNKTRLIPKERTVIRFFLQSKCIFINHEKLQAD